MSDTSAPPTGAWLDRLEALGNRLPEPAILFLWLIGVLIVASVAADAAGWSASLPFSGAEAPAFATLENGVVTFAATSLLSPENLRRLLTEMPRTLTAFPPLGVVLLIVFGAAVAERSGLFAALVRAGLGGVPRALLTPIVAIVGMLSHLAVDIAYIVFIPLAAVVFAAAGRHPLAGLAAAFAAAAGGFAGNFLPGPTDVTLFAFTEAAARIVDPAWRMNPLGNWWFIVAVAVVFTPVTWFITDRLIEPRLGPWRGSGDTAAQAELGRAALTPAERRGLRHAAAAAGLLLAGFLALTVWPGAVLLDAGARGPAHFTPLFGAIVPLMTGLMLAGGIAYGRGTGALRTSSDVLAMMAEGVRLLAPYFVFVLFAAHFVAMFNWSRLGPILAIEGAETLRSAGVPPAVLLVSVLLMSSVLDLFIGSATAKWSALAPVVVPMFMLLGISPEMTQAAYRMGDSFTNIMTPLMAYFPMILGFARRWDPQAGTGSLLALMLPYGLAFMAAGVLLVIGWILLGIPPGPGASVHWSPPA